ncbi:MAG: CoA transferase [Actinomycetota bacterium]|nr:CoA transferase [Actinomycetota bacterium]
MTVALQGLRILDLSRLFPGDFCSLFLADFGADVVKVEDTGMGDYVRWAPPRYEGVEESAAGALFLGLNRGKRSIRIDLKTEPGKGVLRRLARDADVLLESFRPGVLDRLGVGYERLREENPGLVYCAITGYGQDGPARERAGHDMNYLALNGILGLTGEADGPPVQAGAQIADLSGALMAAIGILVALRERERSGLGQLVDCSMFDGSLSSLAMVAAATFASGRADRRGENVLAGAIICYRPYRCADGYVTLGALEPKFWKAFCRGAGREDLLDSAFERPGSEAHRELEEIFAARTREEWREFASEHDCCLEPVLDLDEALRSELVLAREMVVELAQPGAERGAQAHLVKLLGNPIKLGRTPAEPARAPGPGLGEHTEEVLSEAGFSAGEIAELLAAGAVAGAGGAGTHQGSFLA